MSKFWSPAIRTLEPYVPGEQPKDGPVIKLNTNENPYPPSAAVASVLADFPVEQLRLYPDPDATELKTALASRHHLDVSQVFVGNGSDEVLGLAFMALLRQSQPILFPEHTYSFYPVYCNLYGIDFHKVPLDEDFCINVDGYCGPDTSANGGIIIANPNAPTGVALPLTDIERLLAANTDSVVIIDEAYVDFGGESATALVNQYCNLLVVQTFSKSRSLAGMRVGFAFGHPDLIDGLERVKNSFNSYPLDMLAIKTAVAALGDETHFQQTRQQIIATREWLTEQLQALAFEVLPSATNFVFAAPTQGDSAALYQQLRQRKILVRYFDKAGISDYLRITVGTQAECEALVAALKELMG